MLCKSFCWAEARIRTLQTSVYYCPDPLLSNSCGVMSADRGSILVREQEPRVQRSAGFSHWSSPTDADSSSRSDPHITGNRVWLLNCLFHMV